MEYNPWFLKRMSQEVLKDDQHNPYGAIGLKVGSETAWGVAKRRFSERLGGEKNVDLVAIRYWISAIANWSTSREHLREPGPS